MFPDNRWLSHASNHVQWNTRLLTCQFKWMKFDGIESFRSEGSFPSGWFRLGLFQRNQRNESKETTNQKGDERQTHAQTERKKREGVVAAAVVVVAAAAGAAAAAVVVVLTLLNRAPIAASTMRETLTHNKNTRKRIVKRKKSHNALPDL